MTQRCSIVKGDEVLKSVVEDGESDHGPQTAKALVATWALICESQPSNGGLEGAPASIGEHSRKILSSLAKLVPAETPSY